MIDRVDELVFIFGVDPGYVETSTPARIRFWHARAFEFMRAREHAITEQRRFDEEIGNAVKLLPAR